MAFSCGFFNSKGLDRTYTAENFTEYLSSIICNGILDTYGQNFKLTAASSGTPVLILLSIRRFLRSSSSARIPFQIGLIRITWGS